MKRWLRTISGMLLAVAAGGALAADYQIGPGDVLHITVFEHPDLAGKSRVGPEGKVRVPLAGAVTVADLTEREAEATIATALQQGGYVSDPQVSVLVEQYQSRLVSVLGYINRPGRYPMDRQLTLVEAVAQAGGVAPSGSEKVVLVTGDGRRQEIDLRTTLADGAGTNPVLRGGEVIYVPRAPMVYVFGEVLRPGAYPLDHHMTVQQGLALGGSISPRGTDRGIRIRRQAADGTVSEIDADFDQPLQAGDIIVVRERLF
jgi:polysaccharide export outer membrane protein